MGAKNLVRKACERVVGPLALDENAVVYDLFDGRTSGVMIDVGAHFGTSLLPFARDGWSIHAFEPDPSNRTVLERNLDSLAVEIGHPPDVRVTPKAVSREPGQMPLYTSPESTGISSLAPFTATHTETASVDVTTLASYVDDNDIDEISFLKIDVEGFERDVLDGHDWRVKPDVIVLEFEDAKTVPLGYSWTDLAETLVGLGYEVVVSEWCPIEQYGIEHTWLEFRKYPTALANDAGWGNLIACLAPPPTLGAVLAKHARRARVARALR